MRSCSRTAEASSRSRLPPQVEHSTSPTRCSHLLRKRRREPRRFFQAPDTALELKAEQRPLVFLALAVGEHVDPIFARAVKHDAPLLGAELIERHVERHAGVCRQAPRASSRTRSSWPWATGRRRPAASVSFGSRNSAAGLAPVCVPRPSHAGHQPSELLNEKLCGVSGSKLRPQLSQAKCWLWISVRHFGSGTSSLGIGDVQHALAQRQRVFHRVGDRGCGRRAARLMRSITTSTRCLRRRSICGGCVDRMGLRRRRASARSPARESRPTGFVLVADLELPAEPSGTASCRPARP